MVVLVCLSIGCVLLVGLGLSLRTRSLLLHLSSEYGLSEVSKETEQEGDEGSTQSLVIGGLVWSRAFSLHRDDAGVVIHPGPWLRRLGSGSSRLPWERLELERTGRRYCTLRIGEIWISGPAKVLLPPDRMSASP